MAIQGREFTRVVTRRSLSRPTPSPLRASRGSRPGKMKRPAIGGMLRACFYWRLSTCRVSLAEAQRPQRFVVQGFFLASLRLRERQYLQPCHSGANHIPWIIFGKNGRGRGRPLPVLVCRCKSRGDWASDENGD